MIRARFRMTLPPGTWISEVSRSFPEATFRLLTGVPLGERAMELGEIVGGDAASAAAAIRSHADVVSYDSLYAGDRRVLAQYESTERRLYAFLGRSSLPPEFPVVVEDGRFEFDLTATREQFEAVGAALDDSEFEYELLSVVEGGDGSAVLTDRQRECLEVALREGYFEVPREATLAEVSEAVGIDKSTASGILRRGQSRVLKRYLLGPD
ncbi:helix-turn-helix domain-containing protein [Halorussus halobius]|uniref:helix-turn-helix domain-containing protein n=1 Tax=Halorussus halobius TaxID=1710537 RepID=UPI00109199B1|nr:helix-turn-helix domain-containing protein [Halorussus halobius]